MFFQQTDNTFSWYTTFCLAMIFGNLLTGCLQFNPSRTYDADIVNYQASSGIVATPLNGHTRTIEANKPWQTSGVTVTPGDTVKILAMGKWSQAPALNVWSGPEGFDGTGKEVPWINANALMGKIGEQGKPFEIGTETELRATGEGEIYLAINDPFPWIEDNAGSMQVTMYIQKDSLPLANLQPAGRTSLSSQANPALAIPAEAGKRTALVIGNSEYQIGRLRNPANDAQDMAEALMKLRFDVTLELNADLENMEHAISEFGRHLYQGGVGLFYYAGHGVQVGGENYLIPVNAAIESESDVRYKAVNIGQVLGKMGEARNGFNIVILDACRDNPFAKEIRSSSRGLAVVNSSFVKGTLIAYATSPGKVASDGDDRNGLYTQHLLQHISSPGLPVEQVFKLVLQGVERDTNGKQSPWTSSSFSGNFFFQPTVQ
ncbi:MAG: caspase family protein [Nitrospirales bacterium]|nr:caspase family protein [Nitrospirales bacterium]